MKLSTLFVAIGVSGMCMAQQAQTTAAPKQVISPKSFNWIPWLPGIEIAILQGNPQHQGPFTVRIRALKGGKIGPHRHSSDEGITILKGRLAVGTGETFNTRATTKLLPGAFLSVPKEIPHFLIFQPETIIQICGEGPFFINAGGRPAPPSGDNSPP